MSKKEEIIEEIKIKIETGEWEPGYKIKAEKYLAEDLSVSRTTLRLALNDLEIMGYIEKKLGSGNYVKNIWETKDKYVVIVIPDPFVKSDFYYSFQYILSRLRILVEQAGYKVFVYYRDPRKNFFDLINIKPENINCFICITLDEPFPESEKYNIPVISVLNVLNFYYTVTIDKGDIYKKIDYLIDKYSLKSLIFLNANKEKNLKEFVLVNNGVSDYFNDKAKVVFAGGKSYTSKERYNNIKNAILENIDNIDSIIFSDDTIYKTINPYLIKHKELTENKKIITHANNPDTFVYPDNVCRIEFDLNVFCDKVLEMMEKLINKETIVFPGIVQGVKIVNEDNLSK